MSAVGSKALQDVLNRICDLYIALIPVTLEKCPTDLVLYAAFVPYLGWEADPPDHAWHGRQIYILDTRRIEKYSHIADLSLRSLMLYAWNECMSEKMLEIESDELSDLLLEWYTYQNDQSESEELSEQIGGAIAKACKTLNERGWNGDQFTKDFVLYTDFVAGDTCSVGLGQCVPQSWLQEKKSQGMLDWVR